MPTTREQQKNIDKNLTKMSDQIVCAKYQTVMHKPNFCPSCKRPIHSKCAVFRNIVNEKFVLIRVCVLCHDLIHESSLMDKSSIDKSDTFNRNCSTNESITESTGLTEFLTSV